MAPVLEEVEDREDLAVGVLLEVAEDGDVAPVADLLAQVGGVEDVFGLEVRVGLVGGEEAEVELQTEVAHRLVEEASVAGLIAGHVSEALGQQGVALFDPTAQFLVKQESGELGGAALLEELDKDLPGLGIEFVGGAFELLVANEVMAVVVLAELLADGFQLIGVGAEVHGSHGLEIRGVEPRSQDCVLHRILRGRCIGRADGCCGVR